MRMTVVGLGSRFAATLLATGLIGCAPAPPVQVVGSPADVESLAGEWTGTYKSLDGGREGSIWFKLVPGEDHAHGDVLMTPQGRSQAYARYKPGEKPGQSGASQFLSIRFVAVSKGEVSGALEPYLGPRLRLPGADDLPGTAVRERVRGHLRHAPGERQHRDGTVDSRQTARTLTAS